MVCKVVERTPVKCCIGVLGVSLSIDYVDLIPVDIPQHDPNMNTLISVTLFFNFRDNSRAFLIITSLVENDKLDMRFSKNLHNNLLSTSSKRVFKKINFSANQNAEIVVCILPLYCLLYATHISIIIC